MFIIQHTYMFGMSLHFCDDWLELKNLHLSIHFLSILSHINFFIITYRRQSINMRKHEDLANARCEAFKEKALSR